MLRTCLSYVAVAFIGLGLTCFGTRAIQGQTMGQEVAPQPMGGNGGSQSAGHHWQPAASQRTAMPSKFRVRR